MNMKTEALYIAALILVLFALVFFSEVIGGWVSAGS